MIKDEISRVIAESALKLGYHVYESSVYLKGSSSTITVKIDSLNGISHYDCQLYSNELGFRLDEKKLLPGYSLEISSPGLDRKLRNAEEFIRFIGAPAKVVYDEDGVRKVVKGIIEDAGEADISVSDEKKIVVKVEYKNIINANLDY
jgi:ribosome maturation factor RimP